MAARISKPGWTTARPSKRAASTLTFPSPVDDAGFYTQDAPGFGPDAEGGAARVIDDKGKKGDANKRVIAALIEHDKLFARGRLKHTYPHSWRSKKPVIFRNTPQWFVSMDEAIEGKQGDTLRKRALERHRRHHLLSAGRPKSPARYDRGAARLGAVASARLGCADHRVHPQGNG
jgi:isoleucyl-tRNA synthetase